MTNKNKKKVRDKQPVEWGEKDPSLRETIQKGDKNTIKDGDR